MFPSPLNSKNRSKYQNSLYKRPNAFKPSQDVSPTYKSSITSSLIIAQKEKPVKIKDFRKGKVIQDEEGEPIVEFINNLDMEVEKQM